jgi:hypothetical protein
VTVKTLQPYPVKSRDRACATFVFCLCATQILAGCAEHNRPAPRFSAAQAVHPRLPSAAVAPPPHPLTEESSDPVPELVLELPPTPPLLTVREAPARPRVVPAPEHESSVASKPEPPVIAPQLAPEEISAARQQMISSLTVAERNLGRSHGKSLTATQSDLAAKVKGFIDDARNAGKEGDWTRARSLATKAQVLSEELVASL